MCVSCIVPRYRQTLVKKAFFFHTPRVFNTTLLTAYWLFGDQPTFTVLPLLQSAYRSHHCTETALLTVLSDVLTAIDEKKATLLALLDLSAAFDCVDLRPRHFTVQVAVQVWPRWCCTGMDPVCFGGRLSAEIALIFGVPHGSVLGPSCFCSTRPSCLTSSRLLN